MDPHLLAPIVTLLLIACGVAVLAEWLKQPYTIALVLVGLVVAIFKLTPSIHISHDVTFTLILPPLLFYGAMHMDLDRLKENWKVIALLAIPGVVLTTLLIGGMLHYMLGLDLIYALLFGALITPTDPISVLSILKKVGAPKRLRYILEGESLFNDGTGVVIFAIILGVITGEHEFSTSMAIVKFLKVALGGAFIGFMCGLLTYKALKHLEDHLLEIALTVVLVFGTPLLAEHFHFSGVIAIVVAGLIMGNYGRTYSMSKDVREALDTFWEVIEFIVNSLIFLVIGIELQVIELAGFVIFAKPIILVIASVLLARLLVAYPLVWIRNKVANNDIPFKWKHILFWGGLKGSLSLALVVGLPQNLAYRDLFLTVAFSMVLFSLVVQGLTIKPIVKHLGISDGKS